MSKLARIASIALILTAATASQALAHAHLKTSSPAEKASVVSPGELDLTFTEELDLKFSGVKLTDLGKKDIELGEAGLKDDGKVLTVPVSATLAPGDYTVDWHVLSTDGHKTSGSYTFTVKP
ncbi:copper homeostasis periplasmic binding protein CopC [Rhizobium esperanzae]|nr:copper homeostasis periplasmic binding protein CopC [Rhizobium esperanzae]